MTKIIKGDLILKENTTFNESIKVKGNIIGDYNLKVIGNINAWNINTCDIKAYDINAKDIICWDIDAYDINVRDIFCWDINCDKINCEDIFYHAVASAYQSFKCKSIEGKRENSKHFCLDKDIEFKETKCSKCGE